MAKTPIVNRARSTTEAVEKHLQAIAAAMRPRIWANGYGVFEDPSDVRQRLRRIITAATAASQLMDAQEFPDGRDYDREEEAA